MKFNSKCPKCTGIKIGHLESTVDRAARGSRQVTRVVGVAAERGKFKGALATDTLASMRAAAQRISKTEASLRGFANVDQGDLQSVRLDEELQAVLSLIPADKRGGGELIEDYADGLPELHVNARAVKQLFMTLLQNAFEALGGEGQVTVRTASSGDAIVTTISDTGRGMDEETQQALFDVTLRNRTGRVAAGFGLPASQSIAERHRGSITVESQLGEGTTFTVTLPVGLPSH